MKTLFHAGLLIISLASIGVGTWFIDWRLSLISVGLLLWIDLFFAPQPLREDRKRK